MQIYIDGRAIPYGENETYYDLINRNFENSGSVILVKENQRLRELHHVPEPESNVKLLTLDDKSAFKSAQCSLCLMMFRAVQILYGDDPDYEIAVHFVVSDGLYCTMKKPELITDEFISAVKTEMEKLRDRAVPFVKKSIPTAKAIEIFGRKGMKDKEELFHYRLTSATNIYDLEGYIDYYYAYMAHDTSYIRCFDLVRYGDGFVLLMPVKDGENQVPEFRPEEKLFQVQRKSLDWGKLLEIDTVADLNRLIVDGQEKYLMLTQEAYHEKQIASMAYQISQDPAKKIVLIAGPSSSGKTTFSHRLSTQLSIYGLNPHPIPVDDYFVDRENTPKDENGNYNFECLEAIDTKQFNEDMLALLHGETVELPTFNFKTGKREYRGNRKKLEENDILVIEGIHGMNEAMSYALPAENKYRIYISALTQINLDEHNRIATTDGRLLRRLVRDARTRGTGAAGTIAMWPSVRHGEENYIFPFQESCDVMFNSALIYELAVLKTFAEPLLFGIRPDDPSYSEARRLLKFLDYFVPMKHEQIPVNSLIREFIGGSCFDV